MLAEQWRCMLATHTPHHHALCCGADECDIGLVCSDATCVVAPAYMGCTNSSAFLTPTVCMYRPVDTAICLTQIQP